MELYSHFHLMEIDKTEGSQAGTSSQCTRDPRKVTEQGNKMFSGCFLPCPLKVRIVLE